MDYITTSETVMNEAGGSEYEGSREGHNEVSMRECEEHAHDRLLQLLITTEHHLVHVF